MKKMKVLVLAVAVAGSVTLTGCATSQSATAYSRSQVQQTQDVQLGTVESVRNVTIEGTKSHIGTGAGAILGGIGGNAIGGGRGKAAATIGGVLLGGLIGAAIEEGATRQAGVEIVVRLDNGRTIAVVQKADFVPYPGQRVRVVTSHNGTVRISG